MDQFKSLSWPPPPIKNKKLLPSNAFPLQWELLRSLKLGENQDAMRAENQYQGEWVYMELQKEIEYIFRIFIFIFFWLETITIY